MNANTERLNMLMQLALQPNAATPVTTDDFLQTLQSIQEALPRLLDLHNCRTTHQQLTEALHAVNNLLYLLKNDLLKHLPGSLKYLRYQAESTHGKLLSTCAYFKEPSVLEAKNLIPVKQIIKTLTGILSGEQTSHPSDQLFHLLQAEINVIVQTKTIPYTRWLWWSEFCLQWSSVQHTDAGTLAEILVTLNFNKGCFIRWLLAALEEELLAITSATQQLEHVLMRIASLYKLPATEGYCTMQASVKQAMLQALKIKLTVLKQTVFLPVSNRKDGNTKINTALSVPQLALLLRLMVDTKIIDEKNTTALLKQVSTAVCTAKTATVSAESLRINYYTPNAAAKNIMKEYLLQMVQLLNRY